MRKSSALFVLLLAMSLHANDFVPPSKAKIEALDPISDSLYIRFAQPVQFETFAATIPTPAPKERDEQRAFDVQLGWRGKRPVYIRVLAKDNRPAGTEWEQLPKDFRDEVATLRELLPNDVQCPRGYTCDQACKRNPKDCCLWHCN